jgi:hypothetical protein
MKNNSEYETFDKAMGTILKANPEVVKSAMEADKRERELEQRRTGKRGRGRPPKQSPSLVSSRASSETG